MSVSARVASLREWSHSAGLAGSGELLPIPEDRNLAVPRRARTRPPGQTPGQTPGGCGAPGSCHAITRSVSSTAWLVCLSWRGYPAQHQITAASRSFASRRAGKEGLRRSTFKAFNGSGACRTNTPSVSSTAWLVCFSWRGYPARHQITAASRSFASRGARKEGLSRSTAPEVQEDLEERGYGTIAGRPAGRQRRQSLSWQSRRTALTSAQLPRAPARATTSSTASPGQ